MQTLTLNDGTVLNGHCALSGDILWLYLDESTLTDAFPILNDPEKVKKIALDSFGDKTTFRGYKHLFCIREEGGSMVSAGLTKG